MSKYEKGSFVTVPNKGHLAGIESYIQCVYLWICHFSDDDGTCYPSRTTLSACAGCSVKSVDRAIDWLCSNGLLKKATRKDTEKNRNLTNLYQMMEKEGGSIVNVRGVATEGRQGSVSQTPGVATEGRRELNPIRTQSNELSSSSLRSEKITESTDEDDPRNLRRAAQLEERGYDSSLTVPTMKRAVADFGVRFANPRVQQAHIKAMLLASYSPDDILAEFSRLLADKFWSDKGVDFGTVRNNIGKARKKKDSKIKAKYEQYA